MRSGAQSRGARNKEELRDHLADLIRETALIPRDLKRANHETVGRSIHGTPPTKNRMDHASDPRQGSQPASRTS